MIYEIEGLGSRSQQPFDFMIFKVNLVVINQVKRCISQSKPLWVQSRSYFLTIACTFDLMLVQRVTKNIQPDLGFDNEGPNKNLCLSKSTCSSVYEIRKMSLALHNINIIQTCVIQCFTELHTGRIGGGNKRLIHENQICHDGFSRHSPFSSESKSQSDLIQLQQFSFTSELHLMLPSAFDPFSLSSPSPTSR